MSTRTFDDKPATREATPLMVGLVGASGTGKTMSSLRLATGIQRVSGGDIFFIDTESRRALHYADKFKFRHLAFGAPFGPLDYLAAIEHCVAKGAKTIVVDSMSHEHEGPGGVLEMHDAEAKRLAARFYSDEYKQSIPAWAKPKMERRRMINTIMQTNCNFIFCFRAKEKLKIVKGKDPEHLGFMPLAGEEFVYEMLCRFLLLPGANGFPTWQSEYPGEQEIMKCPEQFLSLFPTKVQLSEDIGQRLAEWAAGVKSEAPDANTLYPRYAACSDPATLRILDAERKALWPALTKDTKALLKGAADAATARVKAASEESAPATREPGACDGMTHEGVVCELARHVEGPHSFESGEDYTARRKMEADARAKNDAAAKAAAEKVAQATA